MIGGGARALHAGGCSRVRAAVQSGAYKFTGWAWRLTAAVSSRVRTILTTTTATVTARRPVTTTAVAAGNSHAHTHTHAIVDGVVGESVRGKTRRTTLVSLLCVICRARACGACVAWIFLRARTLSVPAAAL